MTREEKAGNRSESEANSRARQAEIPREHPLLAEVEDRTEYIAQLMAEQVWTPKTTRRMQRELAERWSVSVITIRHYSSEAGRRIAQATRERAGELAEVAVKTLKTVTRRGTGKGRMPGDLNAAVNASNSLLELAGLKGNKEQPEDRPSTLQTVQIGTVVTSPVFVGMLPGVGAILPAAPKTVPPHGPEGP